MGNKVGDKSMSKLMTTISRPIMVTLAILIIFVAAGCAHTYSPKQDLDIEWDLSLIHISEPTRLGMISYAVFCLKKKKKQTHQIKHILKFQKTNKTKKTHYKE